MFSFHVSEPSAPGLNPPPGTFALNVQVRAVATEFLRRRPAIVIPFLGFTVFVLAWSGAPQKQVAPLGSAATLLAAYFLYERHLGKTRVFREAELFRSLVATALGITAGATITGALASPLLPMLFAPIGVGFAAFGRSRKSGVLLALLLAIALFLFVASPALSALVVPEQPRRLILVAALVTATLLLGVGVVGLAAAHRRAAESLALAGDEIARSALARTQSLEVLASKVAHEVKNPLTAVRTVVEVMLEAHDADERTKKRLSVAAGEIARIQEILERYGSMNHPFETIRREETDVVALGSGLVALLEARAARRGVSLRLDAPASLAFDVDAGRLKESLVNLLLNAIDATASGGRVVVAVALDGAGALTLTVADTGRGMTATTLAKVGTPFFTTRERGTGLGVALARTVAEQHGGTLTYASELGRGTTATIRIPREHATRRSGV
jgi:signal transduction histidine kinase